MGQRRGITLIEIMVVLAIMGVVGAAAVPSLQAVFDLEQRGAAKELVDTYRLLQTEAVLRNVSFRVAFNLDQRKWYIEVGDPSALVFSDPETREKYERERQDQLKRFSKQERESGAAQSALGGDGKFQTLNTPLFTTQHELPANTMFAYVYTPQYGEPVRPSDEPPESSEDERVVYSHIFPDGTMEYTIVRIVDSYDPADGYSIEVEPFSGDVRLEDDEQEIGANQRWIPSEGPSIR